MNIYMNLNELRSLYLDYYSEKGHTIVPSSSLVPENDPTTLFTGSGMQPMVPYLLGQTHPLGKRLADSQKCFRSQDIEEVGDNRHTTFFEMLGNWSFGDYFKQEQIPWVFTFLVEKVGLDPKNVYVSVYQGNSSLDIDKDVETSQLWQNLFSDKGIKADIIDDVELNGMQGGRIFYYNEKENWWSRVGVPENMPIGEPGGPDSEIFWDFGPELKLHESSEWSDLHCHPACDCGRFLEIGNSVFMEYIKTESGFEALPQKNVDFGGGLERIMAAKLNVQDIFLIDVFDEIRERLVKLSGKEYGKDARDTHAFRVVMDHMRAAVFLIGDNVLPSNKDQGYFVRRLIRRAIRFADQLGVTDDFAGEIVDSIIIAYENGYPELTEKRSFIVEAVVKEEAKFRKTLSRGLKEFNKIIKGFEVAKEKSGKIITELSGKHAFKLYDTYGFPIEVTQDVAKDHGLAVDISGFEELLKKHQETSRQSAEKKFKGGLADDSYECTKYHTATHLLNQALHEVLGNHIEQRGSNITKDRLRFDFSHPHKLTDEEKSRVEEIVNSYIEADLPVHKYETNVKDAREAGALGVFEERYGDNVFVYYVGETPENAVSKEICGGPHVTNTGELGTFKIKKEESSSSGVRRIKAILS